MRLPSARCTPSTKQTIRSCSRLRLVPHSCAARRWAAVSINLGNTAQPRSHRRVERPTSRGGCPASSRGVVSLDPVVPVVEAARTTRKGVDRRQARDRKIEARGAEIVGNVGIGFSELGMAAPAEQHLAAAELTASSPFVHSLYVARQAKTAIRARQPEVAAERMTELVAIAPLVDSPRLRIHERHIIDGTRHWAGVAPVRDARDALREGAA